MTWTWADYLPYVFLGAGALMLLAANVASWWLYRQMRRNDERLVDEWNRQRPTDREVRDAEMHEAEPERVVKRTLAALRSINRTLLGAVILVWTLAGMAIVSHGHVPLWLVLVVSLAIGLLVPLEPKKDEEEDQ